MKRTFVIQPHPIYIEIEDELDGESVNYTREEAMNVALERFWDMVRDCEAIEDCDIVEI